MCSCRSQRPTSGGERAARCCDVVDDQDGDAFGNVPGREQRSEPAAARVSTRLCGTAARAAQQCLRRQSECGTYGTSEHRRVIDTMRTTPRFARRCPRDNVDAHRRVCTCARDALRQPLQRDALISVLRPRDQLARNTLIGEARRPPSDTGRWDDMRSEPKHACALHAHDRTSLSASRTTRGKERGQEIVGHVSQHDRDATGRVRQ